MTEQERPVTAGRQVQPDSVPPPTAGLASTNSVPLSATKRRVAQAKEGAFRLSGVLENTVLGRLWSRLLEMEFVDRSVALAAKAFVSLFPAIIIVTAITPDSVRQDVLDNMSTRFGVRGSAFEVVKQAFATPAATRAASGVIGTILTIAFAVSFTTALQRTYLRAWRRPPGGGAKNKFRGAAWIGGVAVLLMLVTLIRKLFGEGPGTTVAWAIGLAGSMAVWWWTARLMTRGEVRWRPLLPTAVITGLGSWLYTVAASFWMPSNVTKNFAQFGAFGIAIAFVTWFTGLAFVIVVAAALGPSLADADDFVGRWLRRGRSTALEDGARPALPPPNRPMRLSDLFGRGAEGSGVTLPVPDGRPSTNGKTDDTGDQS
jgi:membrane protein